MQIEIQPFITRFHYGILANFIILFRAKVPVNKVLSKYSELLLHEEILSFGETLLSCKHIPFWNSELITSVKL